MSTFARRRIVQDVSRAMREPPPGIITTPFSDNIMICHAVISGPIDTYWEAVYPDGNICLDILQNKWSAMFDVSSALTSIQSLLADPNPESPANTEAAKLFKEDLTLYNKLVLKCVEDSWCVSSLKIDPKWFQ